MSVSLLEEPTVILGRYRVFSTGSKLGGLVSPSYMDLFDHLRIRPDSERLQDM